MSTILIVDQIRRARQRLRRLLRLDAWRNMSVRILVTGASLTVFLGLPISDARAQYYIGAQAGWTGLPYQTDTIDGLAPVPVQFNAGYNAGVRGGYRWGPWRFKEEYSYRQNNTAEYGVVGDSTNGVSGNRHP